MQSVQCNALLERYPLDDLQQASTFGALDQSTLHWLLDEGRISQLEPGEVLFEPGDRGDSFFVILDGSVDYYKVRDNVPVYVRSYRKGEQIGFVSTIALHDRVGRTVARERLLVLEIDSKLFYRLHQHAPTEFGVLMLNLAREMARTMRSLTDILVETKTAERLAPTKDATIPRTGENPKG